MSLPPQCGVFRDGLGPPHPLPLKTVNVNVKIVDVSAKVVVSQAFWNDSEEPFQAKYVFPVPARAAVCGFEMRTEDGRVIQSVAKEKDKAKQDHDQAINQGKATGLVTRATDDLFTLSLGCIPEGQNLSVQLVYTFDLSKSEQDTIRFYLPAYVGTRYGSVPDEIKGAQSTSDSKVEITTFVQMPGTVSVMCPTHPDKIITPSSSYDGSVASTCATIEFRSDTFLKEDFVLDIKAQGLDKSRCFVEKRNGSLAMQLVLVPSDSELPKTKIPSQEYIVLIDRSGSMEGARIDKAKEALVVLLRKLPKGGTTFNIVSFGNKVDMMKKTSLEYDQESLDSATSLVESMSANMGGTELVKALQCIFDSRQTDCPTSVIILTDGETFDIDRNLGLVYEKVHQAPSGAPLRIFTLGIGETTSSAMCEGLARVGNGVCVMTTNAENIVANCSRIVNASMSQSVPCDVEWRVEGYSSIYQSPRQIKSVYPGYRCVITALIEGEDLQPPDEVIVQVPVTAVSDGEIRVPVRLVDGIRHERVALIHTQAARQYIRELEDEILVQSDTKERNIEEIVRLGERYQLASRHTSFVAVDEGQSANGTIQSTVSSVSPKQIGEGVPDAKGSPKPSTLHPTDGSPTLSARGRLQHIVPLAPAHSSPHYNDSDDDDFDLQPRGRVGIPLSPQPEKSNTSGKSQTVGARTQGSNTEDPCKSTLSESANQGSTQLDSHVPSSTPPSSSLEASQAVSQTVTCAPSNSSNILTHSTQPVSPTPIRIGSEADIYKLVKLQRFDGSFSPTPKFVEIFGDVAVQRGRDWQCDEIVWATALAIAFFKKFASNRPEFLENLLEKSLEFLQGNTHAQQSGIQVILDRAMSEV